MRMGRILLLCAIASASQAAPVETVTLANGDWPPYMARDLPSGGPASQIAEEAFAAEGIKVIYQYLPWRRGFEEARTGRIDGSLGWARTPEREADFLFSDPLLITHIMLFHSSRKTIQWQSAKDLAPYRLGGVDGYTYGEEIGRLQAAGVLKMELTTGDDVNLRKIAVDHIDASPIDREVGRYYLATSLHEYAGQVTFDPREMGEAPHYLLISKKAPNAEELVRRFNLGLAKLRSSGRLAQIDVLPAGK